MGVMLFEKEKSSTWRIWMLQEEASLETRHFTSCRRLEGHGLPIEREKMLSLNKKSRKYKVFHVVFHVRQK
jgi:hypothetical protein